jgi:cytoskeletal protein CcmA (bactofilin family)
MKLRRFNGPEARGFPDGRTELIGNLRFSDILHFHGNLKGRIISDGELVVGERGTIECDVEVGVLTRSGTLRHILAKQFELDLGKCWEVYKRCLLKRFNLN